MASKDQVLRKVKIEITAWLSQLFGSESVPDFEMNAQTIKLLHQLLEISRHNEKNTKMSVEDLKKKTEEYNADAQRVCNIMGKLTLGPNSFSPSGLAYMQALAKTGALLSVKGASDTSYMLTLRELQSEVDDIMMKMQLENQELNRHSRQTQEALLKHDSLQKALTMLKHKSAQAVSQCAERKKNMPLLKTKTAADENNIAKLQAELEKMNMSESIFHETLMKKGERLEGLENELAPLKSELESYASLPPNVVETKVKIEQLRRELRCLETQMTESVNVSALM